MRHRQILAALLLGVVAVTMGPSACKREADVAAKADGIGIVADWMDLAVRPGDDFFAYANGNWVRSTEIPADRSSIGGFFVATETTDRQLGELIARIGESAAAANSDEGRIRDFYHAYLNTEAIESAGLKPVKADLARIAAIRDVPGLSRVLGEQVRADVDPLNNTDFHTENLFGLFVTQSLAGGEVLPYVLQGGLGLPEREYYLSADPRMVQLREKYKAYIAQLLANAAVPDAGAKAQRVFDLELKIAQAHLSREVSEDFEHAATEWGRSDFAIRAPGIAWDAFFAGAQLPRQQRFAAYHVGAITGLSALVASQPLEAWRDWLTFHQLNANADVLPAKFDQESFDFYGTAFKGIKAQRPRDKRALTAINSSLGDALGRLYVKEHFPPSAKAGIEGMVDAIKLAFAQRVEALDWMAPTTRREALAKVRSIEVGVGYPDRWTDYSDLTVDPAGAYANKLAAGKLRYARQLAKLGKPLDRREWWMNAQLVNAVNLPVQNAINFPAAILQRPFFDPSADPAFNYGAIGAVIGHEISHSFDNNGAAFDASGKLRNWWQTADLARFEQSSAALARQYDAYAPFPGVHINGEFTLGENIADVAGLAAAYDAYRASLRGKEAPVIDGFTGDQRFFIAYAQTWASKYRDETLRARIAIDGHTPGMYRALTVRNLDAWYTAFGVKPGDKLYLPPEQRVKVW